jgi:hypothetical protein
MKILSQCALAGVLFSVASACATPVELPDDLQQVDPNALRDGGVPGGGSGGSAGNGAIGQGGSGQSGFGGTASGGRGGAGGQPGGVGGTTGGGGAAGASGAGGSLAGGAGGAAGAAGTAGTGGTGSASVFDPEACDFENVAGCEAFACAQACPPNMGTYCTNTCTALVTCVSGTTPVCASEQDPVCGTQSGGVDSECTFEANQGGGAATTDVNSPTFKARALIDCLCSVPRP